MQDPGFVRRAFSDIADRYVLTNHVLSLGSDIWWRRRFVRTVKAHRPARVLDVLRRTRATTAIAVPAVLSGLVGHLERTGDEPPRDLRFLGVGGQGLTIVRQTLTPASLGIGEVFEVYNVESCP